MLKRLPKYSKKLLETTTLLFITAQVAMAANTNNSGGSQNTQNTQNGSSWQDTLNWGKFDVDTAFKTVAALPADLLKLVRYGTFTLAIILFFWMFWMLGVSGFRHMKGMTVDPNQKSISISQFLIGFSLAIALYTISESLLIFRITKGVLEGDGQSVIEHPLGHVVQTQPDYGITLLKVFTLNSTMLIGFLFVAIGFYRWWAVSVGKAQYPARDIGVRIGIGALFFSFEWTYRFVASSFGLGDPLGILFN